MRSGDELFSSPTAQQHSHPAVTKLKKDFPTDGKSFFCNRKLARWASEGVAIRPDELWS